MIFMKNTKFSKICPGCGNEQFYVYKCSLVSAIKHNTVCKKCMFTDEYRNKLLKKEFR